MMVTNFTIADTSEATLPAYEMDIGRLDQVASGRFIADTRMVRAISNSWRIDQFRFYCRKKNVGRTIHFKSKMDNEPGRKFRDAVFDKTINWNNPVQKCTDVFEVYSKDSFLLRDCNVVRCGVVSSPDGSSVTDANRLYRHLFYVHGSYHYQLVPNRIECDDQYGGDPVGTWQIYVRWITVDQTDSEAEFILEQYMESVISNEFILRSRVDTRKYEINDK